MNISPIQERMFFVKQSAPKYRTNHLHLTPKDSGFWKNQLAFRNYLRKHGQIAAEYSDLKQHLAEIYAHTQQLDLDGKSEFVAKVLELAEKEEREVS